MKSLHHAYQSIQGLTNNSAQKSKAEKMYVFCGRRFGISVSTKLRVQVQVNTYGAVLKCSPLILQFKCYKINQRKLYLTRTRPLSSGYSLHALFPQHDSLYDHNWIIPFIFMYVMRKWIPIPINLRKLDINLDFPRKSTTYHHLSCPLLIVSSCCCINTVLCVLKLLGWCYLCFNLSTNLKSKQVTAALSSNSKQCN